MFFFCCDFTEDLHVVVVRNKEFKTENLKQNRTAGQ